MTEYDQRTIVTPTSYSIVRVESVEIHNSLPDMHIHTASEYDNAAMLDTSARKSGFVVFYYLKAELGQCN